MSKTKSKILAIFLITLFFQRIGPACYLKNYISVHFYKEQPDFSVHTAKGKLVAHSLFSVNNRIYEECHNAILNTPIVIPIGEVRYFELGLPHSKDFVCIAVFMKQTSLRGPPAC